MFDFFLFEFSPNIALYLFLSFNKSTYKLWINLALKATNALHLHRIHVDIKQKHCLSTCFKRSTKQATPRRPTKIPNAITNQMEYFLTMLSFILLSCICIWTDVCCGMCLEMAFDMAHKMEME